MAHEKSIKISNATKDRCFQVLITSCKSTLYLATYLNILKLVRKNEYKQLSEILSRLSPLYARLVAYIVGLFEGTGDFDTVV